MGISSTGRPVDPDSFTFFTPVVDNAGWTYNGSGGLGDNDFKSLPFSVPYCSFVGLPASAQVFYEVVVNIEATQAVLHNGSTILGDAGLPIETVGDHWPTPESLHRTMGKALPHPGRPEEAAASKDAGFLQALWGGLKKGAVNGVKAITDGAIRLGAATAAQKLLGGSGTSGQRYGRQFAGYLQ